VILTIRVAESALFPVYMWVSETLEAAVNVACCNCGYMHLAEAKYGESESTAFAGFPNNGTELSLTFAGSVVVRWQRFC
jgi:hypothetical protein